MAKKKAKSKEELSEKDKLILMKVKEDPEKPMNQIGKELVELGVYKHPGSIYRRLTQQGILRREIAEIEEHWRQHLHRELYPLAAKRWKRALKNKDLNDKEVFSYVKLAADKVHAETTRVEIPDTLRVGVLHAFLDDLLPSKKEGG
jgi:DNA-binding Lrp family transcriptional regulator